MCWHCTTTTTQHLCILLCKKHDSYTHTHTNTTCIALAHSTYVFSFSSKHSSYITLHHLNETWLIHAIHSTSAFSSSSIYSTAYMRFSQGITACKQVFKSHTCMHVHMYKCVHTCVIYIRTHVWHIYICTHVCVRHYWCAAIRLWSPPLVVAVLRLRVKFDWLIDKTLRFQASLSAVL
jgi:hypothetical protein